MTPMQAIRQHCLDCCCDQPKEVRLCTCFQCALYPFRMGKNPQRAGVGGENSHSHAEKRTEQDEDN